MLISGLHSTKPSLPARHASHLLFFPLLCPFLPLLSLHTQHFSRQQPTRSLCHSLVRLRFLRDIVFIYTFSVLFYDLYLGSGSPLNQDGRHLARPCDVLNSPDGVLHYPTTASQQHKSTNTSPKVKQILTRQSRHLGLRHQHPISAVARLDFSSVRADIVLSFQLP